MEVSVMDSSKESMGIRFANPPVSEVIISLQYETVTVPLNNYGTLMDQFSPVYPTKSDGPGPRAVQLLSEDESQILQLDPERLTTNWRGRGTPYPGHACLHQRFAADLEEFSTFLERGALGKVKPKALLLAYANQVPILDMASYAEQLQRLFPDIQWRISPDRKLPTPAGVNWQTIFHPDRSGILTVYLQAPALAMEGRWKGSPVIRFDFVAQGEATGETTRDEVLDWFKRAHEWILNAFQELTSEEFKLEHWNQIRQGG